MKGEGEESESKEAQKGEVLQMKGEMEPMLGQLEAILPGRPTDQDLVLGA